MKKLYVSKTLLKMTGGRMHKCIPLILPSWIRPGHKLQKPSKESGVFQLLGTINFVLVYFKAESKPRAMAQWPPS